MTYQVTDSFRYRVFSNAIRVRAIAINEDWKQKMNWLTSVPGIGEVVAVTLISSLPELSR